jgi:ubiquinone/menaquinone biosynthesis C-methylase UbiE
MDHHESIYRSQAGAYQRMIAAEDVDGNLIATIQRVCDPRGKRLLDLGCGTGRLPGLLQSMTSYLVGIDLHRAMLEENAAIRNDSGGDWSLVQGDMRWLPFAAKTFDILTAGWAIGHMRGWFSQNWKAAIGQVLDEMHRATCPGGALIILETLGTGTATPAPPTPELVQYYLWLEKSWHFKHIEIQTDFQYPSVQAAIEATEFFFGSQLSEKIERNNWARIPEWTGMWWKTLTK